jgi:hypothetical protein
MADLIELEQWEAGIYQLETDDPVLGGVDGIDNLQAKQLANRTKYLKAQVELDNTNLAAHLADLTDAHDASAISYAGGTGIAATDVEGALDELANEKANLASPAFTDIPTAPTAAPGTNTIQLATTAFIQAAITALINSSPAALDTLNELAAALGNDANFATTINNALALKAALASPIFTGDPKAPTPAQFDNDISLATTEFVKKQGLQASGVFAFDVDTILTSAHVGAIIYSFGFAAKTFTLPLLATVPPGARIEILNSSSGVLTIVRQGADNINRQTGTITSFTVEQGSSVVLVYSAASGTWFIVGGHEELQFLPSFAKSIAGNGYQKLPGGVIIQWGVIIGSASADTSIVFPIAFPTAVRSINANSNRTGTPGGTFVSQNNPTTTGFDASTWTATATRVAVNGNYIAIGN